MDGYGFQWQQRWSHLQNATTLFFLFFIFFFTSEHYQVFQQKGKKKKKKTMFTLPKHSADTAHYITGACQSRPTLKGGKWTQNWISHSYKKKKKKKTTRKLGFISTCMGAEEWSLSVSHLHGWARGRNCYHMEPKGRKRMLLRQPESYGLPDLLAYKINKGTATACKCV